MSSRIKKLTPVVPATSRNVSRLQAFISVVNFYENPLFVVTVAHDAREAKKLLEEMYAKGHEINPERPGTFVDPFRFDSWWEREYTLSDFIPLYKIDTSKPGVYIFRGPDVDSNFR